jgi:hypothetical protein
MPLSYHSLKLSLTTSNLESAGHNTAPGGATVVLKEVKVDVEWVDSVVVCVVVDKVVVVERVVVAVVVSVVVVDSVVVDRVVVVDSSTIKSKP